jgi:hypothetical protein
MPEEPGASSPSGPRSRTCAGRFDVFLDARIEHFTSASVSPANGTSTDPPAGSTRRRNRTIFGAETCADST